MIQAQKIFYEIIDEILWTEWDPIGVNDYDEARDEYYSYIPLIIKLKIENSDKETIAKYLFNIETEQMGLFGNLENCRRVANKIVSISTLP